MVTNVPPITFGPNGPVAPSESAILAGVQADLNAAFGGNLNPSLSTPQGQIASSEAAIIGQSNDEFLFLANNFDPAFASGRYQDALARIYFIERLPAQPTVVQALCTGLDGVIIPAGALAQAADGNIYTCTEAGTIQGGSVTLPFACNVPGPIACPADSLNVIYQAIFGWNTINNPGDGVEGNVVESRAQFEARRAASVGKNSIGSLSSILGAVLDVAGVLDAYVTENTANSPATIGGVSLAAHSVFVAVVGGAALDVATAIWSKKAPGCDYNGNTVETVQDTNSGYAQPYPSYQVTFETPAALPVFFKVNIANNPQVPANAVTLIQNAIIAAFAGADGGARARIGSTIYASRFYAPIAALGPWVQIISIVIGSANNPAAAFNGSIAATALTVDSGTGIANGQILTDATGDVLPGTAIVSGSGTAWVVSNSQTVATEPMNTVAPALNDVVVNINQSPTINALDIAVTLT
jgi:hypothetical protein